MEADHKCDFAFAETFQLYYCKNCSKLKKSEESNKTTDPNLLVNSDSSQNKLFNLELYETAPPPPTEDIFELKIKNKDKNKEKNYKIKDLFNKIKVEKNTNSKKVLKQAKILDYCMLAKV